MAQGTGLWWMKMMEYGMLVGADRNAGAKARLRLFPLMANVVNLHNLPSAPHLQFLVILEDHEAAQTSPNTKVS